MKFWIDAQLPPLLAEWLAAQFSVEAFSLRALGLRDAADAAIFQAAQQQGIVLISKDSDFVELFSRYRPPPQLILKTAIDPRKTRKTRNKSICCIYAVVHPLGDNRKCFIYLNIFRAFALRRNACLPRFVFFVFFVDQMLFPSDMGNLRQRHQSAIANSVQ